MYLLFFSPNLPIRTVNRVSKRPKHTTKTLPNSCLIPLYNPPTFSLCPHWPLKTLFVVCRVYSYVCRMQQPIVFHCQLVFLLNNFLTTSRVVVFFVVLLHIVRLHASRICCWDDDDKTLHCLLWAQLSYFWAKVQYVRWMFSLALAVRRGSWLALGNVDWPVGCSDGILLLVEGMYVFFWFLHF